MCLKRHPSVPPQNSPESVLPDLPAFVGICKKLYRASARCTSMGDASRCTFGQLQNAGDDKIVDTMYTSPIVFVRGKRKCSVQQGWNVQSTAQRTIVCGKHTPSVKTTLTSPMTTLDFTSTDHIRVLIVQMFEPTPGRCEDRSPV